jgi:hypothetical protein
MVNYYWDTVSGQVGRLGRRQRAALVAGAAQRVFDVVLDSGFARKDAAKRALKAIWNYVDTGDFDASTYAALREQLADDHFHANEQLSTATSYALKAVLEAYTAVGEDNVDAALNGLTDAVTTSYNADERNTEQARAEEEAWQIEALERITQHRDEPPTLDELRAIGHWPPEWLLRFEGS